MKTLAVALLFSFFSGGFPTLAGQSRASAKVAEADAQEQCNQQAFAVYKDEGYSTDPTASYTIHFSARLKSCFVLLRKVDRSTVPGGELESRVLLDASTKKIYGNYLFSSESQRAMECDVVDSLDKKKNCSSSNEFEAMIAPYME
jgi:hypothetical protein